MVLGAKRKKREIEEDGNILRWTRDLAAAAAAAEAVTAARNAFWMQAQQHVS